MRNAASQKWNMFLRGAVLVLLLVTVVACWIPGLYARYVTFSAGDDSTRVAKFDVKLTATAESSATGLDGLTNDEKTVDTKTYAFSVTGNSEVATEYDICVRFSNPLPEGIVPTVRIGSKAEVSGTPDAQRKSFTFVSSDFAFGMTDQTNTHTLTVTVNYYDASNNLRNVDLSATEVSISVTARQVD